MEQNNNLGMDFFDKKRYPALRTVAGIFISYAIIVGILSIIATFRFLIDQDWEYAFFALTGGIFLTLTLVAYSESIKVFLDIEHNTRRALMPVVLEEEDRKNDKSAETQVKPLLKEDDLENDLEDESSALVKDSEKVKELHSLINAQKANLFGTGNKMQIIDLITDLCPTNDYAEGLLLYYKRNYDKDLLNELKSLTTNYSSIKDYLNQFIKLGIVKEEYPHDKIS